MVKKCAIVNCPIKARTKVGQFSFPVKRDLCLRWVAATGRGHNFRPTLHSRVCEIHFREDDFRPDEGKKRRRLKAGAVPSLNLNQEGELTEAAQQVLQLQREAERQALEEAKEALERNRQLEDEARQRREQNEADQLFVNGVDGLRTEAKRAPPAPPPQPIVVEHLPEIDGLKIVLPARMVKNPSRLGRLFRDANVLDYFKSVGEMIMKSSVHPNGKRKRKPEAAFVIYPLSDGHDHPKTTMNGQLSTDELLKMAAAQNAGGRRRTMPPWFRQGDTSIVRPPPAELSKLKPVPVSKALHLLFKVEQPEMPSPPPTLPPINAKLIFVDKSSLSSTSSTKLDGDSTWQNHRSVTLEVPKVLPEGPIAFLDPDGLQKEVEHWRSQVDHLQNQKFDLEVKLANLRKDRKKWQVKAKTLERSRDREAVSEKKRKLKTSARVAKLKNEISSLRKFKRQVLNTERAKKLKTSEANASREYVVHQVFPGDKTVTTTTPKRTLNADGTRSGGSYVIHPEDLQSVSNKTPQFFQVELSDELATASGANPSSGASKTASTTTTVMIPSETVYATDNGEYQHIEIITMEMDTSGFEPRWPKT